MNSTNQPKRTAWPLLLVVSLFAIGNTGSISPVAAQSIGVNFVGGAGAAGTLSPTDLAGVPGHAQAFWNNALVSAGPLPGFGSLSNLIDGAGQQSSIDTEWVDVNGVGTTGSSGVGPDFTLMQGFLRASLAGNGIIFRDIPYPVYDVIIYMSGPPSSSGLGNWFYRSPDFITFPPAAERYCPKVLYSQSFDGSFLEATPTTAGNYYRIPGLTFSSVGIGSIYFPMSAVQIVPVPEPSPMALLVLAAASLAFYHCRKPRRADDAQAT